LLGVAVRFDSVQLKFWTNPIMIEFCFGVVLFKMWEQKWIPMVPPGVAIVMATIPMVVLGTLERQGFAGERFLWSGVPAFFVVMLALTSEGRLAIPALLVMIGDASYSLYLFHPYLVIGLYKVLAIFSSSIVLEYLLIGPAVILAVVFALLSYRFIERPSNIWLRSKYRSVVESKDTTGSSPPISIP